MSSFSISKVSFLKGKIKLPADKSITHRAIIISSISKGKTIIDNFSLSRDCLYTLEAFRKLGIKIIKKDLKLLVYGRGLYGLRPPKSPIFVGDSGTTFRLLCGVLAGQDFSSVLTAGKSLSRRPMLRVTQPLRMMGARIISESKIKNLKEEYPPIIINGAELKAITYRLPVASAQVKSAILLAGLYAEGTTKIIEPIPTRDHTERMLKLFKASLTVKKKEIAIKGKRELTSPGYIFIPGDISSASFFIVGSLILEGSSLLINSVSLNPTRLGLIKVLKRMGAKITLKYRDTSSSELIGDVWVKSSRLRSTVVKAEEVPSLIDEIPILMVASCFAEGRTLIESVQELRVKETDRIRSMVEGLTKMGAKVSLEKNGAKENIIIEGETNLKGNKLNSYGDHRTAMSLVIAGLKAKGKTVIDDISCIKKSFPNFLEILKGIIH
ncbi:MAG: 3-phosphoshikimate 1-carboxyvinyltransferase [Candidatus Omnitrophica bacterium]|nr:3-phosphoshikimate 1-carboxyvinyltransferase [Candidatus Omnitrophota bacterium]